MSAQREETVITRIVGSTLLWTGATIGAAAAVALLTLSGLHGLAWVAGVGLVKLTPAGSVGLMAGGAFVRRLALRQALRQRMLEESPGHVRAAPADSEEPHAG